MHVVAVGRQGPAQRVDGTDRAAVAKGRQIGRNDVKKAQGSSTNSAAGGSPSHLVPCPPLGRSRRALQDRRVQ
jgi:hypothetical protein